MSDIVSQCPHCKARFKVRSAEKLNGKKIRCGKCEKPYRIKLPGGAAPSDDDIIDAVVVEDDDIDEYAAVDDDDYAPEPKLNRLPTQGRKAVIKKIPKKPQEEAEPEKPARKKKSGPSAMTIAAVVVGSLAFVGLLIGGAFAMRGQGGGEFVEPVKYEDLSPKDSALSAMVPEGWETRHGGGKVSWMTMTNGQITVEARESISGGAMGAAGLAMDNNLGDKVIPAVELTHLSMKEQFALNYASYDEGPPIPIKTGYGEARISDFTGEEGIFRKKVKGCRATLLNNLHMFTVKATCPPALFDAARPTIVKIVEGLATGKAP